MTYKIAGITVNMNPKGDKLLRQAEAYLIENNEKADIHIDLEYEKLNEIKQDHLSFEELEYIYAGFVFYNRLIDFDGFFLHSSAVSVDDRAYLFSAPSGTGKSTHANLWLKYLGKRAEIINDDKPAIKLIDNEFFVFGTPFSGKTDLNKNKCVRLGAICMLERDERNSIKRITSADAIYPILNQTLRPKDYANMDKLLNLLNLMLKSTPVYKLKCNMDISAAEIAFEAMSEKHE